MEFEEVDYWEELTKIMDWSEDPCHFHHCICAGRAQAGLYHHYGI